MTTAETLIPWAIAITKSVPSAAGSEYTTTSVTVLSTSICSRGDTVRVALLCADLQVNFFVMRWPWFVPSAKSTFASLLLFTLACFTCPQFHDRSIEVMMFAPSAPSSKDMHFKSRGRRPRSRFSSHSPMDQIMTVQPLLAHSTAPRPNSCGAKRTSTNGVTSVAFERNSSVRSATNKRSEAAHGAKICLGCRQTLQEAQSHNKDKSW